MTKHYEFKDPQLSDEQRQAFSITCIVPLIMMLMALMGVEYIFIGTMWTLAGLIALAIFYTWFTAIVAYRYALDEIERRKKHNENPPVKEIVQTQTKDGYENLYYYAEPLEIEPVSVYWKEFFKQLLWIS